VTYTDLQITGFLAALVLPYLVWVNASILWKGEIHLSDESGKVTSQHTRVDDPVMYWLLATYNLALTAGCAVFVAWVFGVFKIQTEAPPVPPPHPLVNCAILA
jgi:hypothetical protein